MSPRTTPGPSWARLIDEFRHALEALGCSVSEARLESLAVGVFTAMSGPLRRFHSLDHVFHFDPADPLETLAVLYHDVVYWSVDQGWPASFAEPLSPVAAAGTSGVRLAPSAPIAHYRDVLAVFGLEPESEVGTGANELFSALAFAAALGADLGRDRTLAVAACIEATIPFRDPACRLVLKSRLETLGFLPAAADLALARAVHMANQDVSDFRLEDPGEFLSGSWDLLPELNPGLRIHSVFTVEAYRKALDGMAKFFGFLTPDKLFDGWGDEPGAATLARWKAQAAANLDTARAYMEAKLLASALIEAFARASGGDAPLSLFMGATVDPVSQRLESHLPDPGICPDDVVFTLLDTGRPGRSSFDLANSPLAAWLYVQTDPEERAHQRQRSTLLFAGTLAPQAFLAGWNPALITPLARALAQQVPTRREVLRALIP